MNFFANPFAPFIIDEMTGPNVASRFQDPLGNTLATSTPFGDSVLLKDAIGQQFGVIQHLSDGSAILKSSLGAIEGRIEHHGTESVLIDPVGRVQLHSDQFASDSHLRDADFQNVGLVHHDLFGSHVETPVGDVQWTGVHEG